MNELKAAADFLKRTEKLIITAHETPDGDALGSECATRRALLSLGKEAIILNSDPTPRKFAFLDPENAIIVLQTEDQLPDEVETYALLMLDTNDIHNIGSVSSLVLPRVREYFIIDHHENEEDVLTGNLILKSASSTCEIVYQLLREIRVDIDEAMAEALYTGIIYDTGCFIYPKTTEITFAIARDLVQKGVQPNAVYAHVYESNSISALLLQSRVLSTLELAEGNHVAILTDEQGNAQRFRVELRGSGRARQHPAEKRGCAGFDLLQGKHGRIVSLLAAVKRRHQCGGDRPDVRRRRP